VNISLVGESTVGKSSLLSVLCAKGRERGSHTLETGEHQPRKIQNLRQQIDDLQQQWETISQQLSKLERSKILETRVDEKFGLEHLIAETRQERKTIETELGDVEAQVSMLTRQSGQQATEPGDRTVVYLNLEWIEDEDDFYDALCDELGIESCRGYKLTRALKGKRYILCLDEIEKMAWEGFTVKLRSQLRGLADGPDAPLKLVIASRSPLARLFPDSQELDSPLAGICRQIDVKPFAPAVAREFLIQQLEGTSISFTEAQIAELISKTSGHPAKLQDEAAQLFHELSRIEHG
jgi:hypothetical protein